VRRIERKEGERQGGGGGREVVRMWIERKDGERQ
jgi:hypothetical protein